VFGSSGLPELNEEASATNFDFFAGIERIRRGGGGIMKSNDQTS
jgi:hypothetical protein